MTRHEITDRQVVIAQLICFALAGFLGFTADLLGNEGSQIVFKLVDAIFITGTILVAMKLARDAWDMAAAGYTLLSIAWGIFSVERFSFPNGWWRYIGFFFLFSFTFNDINYILQAFPISNKDSWLAYHSTFTYRVDSIKNKSA